LPREEQNKKGGSKELKREEKLVKKKDTGIEEKRR
jgi:hypothetical protein